MQGISRYPPYGQHRGLYKGLGEEPKIARYEDYFIKRSLDLMNDGGILAMVVPSTWLNRQNNLKNAELSEAYRLPNGVFKATDVGTDIIVLKKNSNAERKDISQYFEQNPNRVLGGETPTTKEFIENSPKLKTTMDLIAQNKKDQPNAGQIIYSELGVAEFPKLKEYLVDEVGYKSDEVGIITGGNQQKSKIRYSREI